MFESKNVPLYLQIQQYIIEQLSEGNLKKGDKLPSENEMAKFFNVSRVTVKNSFTQLIEKGIIYREKGRGTFVGERINEFLAERNKITKANKKKLIAYIAPGIRELHSGDIFEGVSKGLSEMGYDLIFYCTEHVIENEAVMIDRALERGVDGIIIFPLDSETYNEKIVRLVIDKFPIVIVDKYVKEIDANCVVSDNFKGTYMGIKHLINMGHKNIGFVSLTGKGSSSLAERLSGYEAALSEHDIAVNHKYRLMSLTNNNPSNAYMISEFLYSVKEITALFAVNKGIGMSCLQQAMALGIEIPGDLSVIFFDSIDFVDLMRIKPTVLKQQSYAIGREAVQLLASFLENKTTDCKKILLPVSLVPGDSVKELVD